MWARETAPPRTRLSSPSRSSLSRSRLMVILETGKASARESTVTDLLRLTTSPELRALMGERDLVRLSGNFEPPGVGRAMAGIDDAEVVTADPATVVLSVREASKRLPAILSAVSELAGPITDTTISQPSLESLFIKLTGRELRE